ncbi:MAG: menaquinone biosynthetic enzyme MqnA/MqnD family protein [bacterium]
MERKIRIGAVSYLNTKPLLYGLQHGPIRDDIELTLDYPSNLVKALKNDQIDIGLLPVAALLDISDYQIVSDYCIGTEGEVASVCVFSEVPLDEIDTVLLDYQSRTSVMLCRILFAKHWKKSVQFINAADETYIDKIKGNVAGLVIGDRALKIRDRFTYIYDLGLGWKEMTGMPFVFAVWVTTSKFQSDVVEKYSNAFQLGINQIPVIVGQNLFLEYNLFDYFTKNISYSLDSSKIKGLKAFLAYIEGME